MKRMRQDETTGKDGHERVTIVMEGFSVDPVRRTERPLTGISGCPMSITSSPYKVTHVVPRRPKQCVSCCDMLCYTHTHVYCRPSVSRTGTGHIHAMQQQMVRIRTTIQTSPSGTLYESGLFCTFTLSIAVDSLSCRPRLSQIGRCG